MAFNRFQKFLLSFVLVIVVAFALFIFIVLFSLNRAQSSPNPIIDLKINGQTIKAEIVKSGPKMYLGLSKRPEMCAGCGMLFLFPDKEIRDFVMRDMEFPLDIIFISEGKIINIDENLMPESDPVENYYVSAEPADAVLELNAGYCQKYNIKAGDSVIY
ncbi:MAG: DUF192 domain-containing protein [Patescibacteria group bacterium]